mmetsp:Transcript_139925/g.390060  ORF Transcript_139925/g.390060 Transcript_139925/m.390060 type:complete len:540 (-) Transcript_139925:129-1748(-)
MLQRRAEAPLRRQQAVPPQTPPRKRPKPSEVDGAGSDAKASAGGSASSGGPQVVFSPGKRVHADGSKHDAGAEVRAFLRHQGYSDQEIRRIMASEAGSSGLRRASVGGTGGAAAATPAAGGGHSPLVPKRFADLARDVQGGGGTSGGGGADDFAADLLDVLGLGDDGDCDAAALPPASAAPAAPAAAAAPAAPAATSTQGTPSLGASGGEAAHPRAEASPAASAAPSAAPPVQPAPLLSQLPAGLQAELCSAAEQIERHVEAASQRSQQLSQPSQPMLSQIPNGLHAELCAAADEIDRLVEDEANQCTQPGQPPPPGWSPGQRAPVVSQAPGLRPGAWQPPGTQAPPARGRCPGAAPPQCAQQAPRPAQAHRPPVWAAGPPGVATAWGQPPVGLAMPTGFFGTMPGQAGAAVSHLQQWCAQPAPQTGAFMQRPAGMPGQQPPLWQQAPPLVPSGPPAAFGMSQPCWGAPGTGVIPCSGTGPQEGSLLDDFDDDDESLLATIRQVEDKVKAEQDHERIMKEREEELNLELMLVDVDPNDC